LLIAWWASDLKIEAVNYSAGTQQEEISATFLLLVGNLASNPEDGDNILFRNFRKLLPDYRASRPRKKYSSTFLSLSPSFIG
jgi:hypothetical protein